MSMDVVSSRAENDRWVDLSRGRRTPHVSKSTYRLAMDDHLQAKLELTKSAAATRICFMVLRWSNSRVLLNFRSMVDSASQLRGARG